MFSSCSGSVKIEFIVGNMLKFAVLIAVCYGAVVAIDDDGPTDHLLPYLQQCCLLGQEFARSRQLCDTAKLNAVHRQKIPATQGLSNSSCSISAASCCEETLEREIHCDQGVRAASDGTCSMQTDLTARACCNWCRAGIGRDPSNCEELPPEIPLYAKEAFISCCLRSQSAKIKKKCGTNDCSKPNANTCIAPIEQCAYDDQGCHYRCVETLMSCGVGYTIDEYGKCQDIDECALKTHSCDSNEICVNTSGSYHCKACHF